MTGTRSRRASRLLEWVFFGGVGVLVGVHDISVSLEEAQ